MSKQPVIAIFDVGKTNKKLFFFNEQYKIVYEEQMNFPQITDEDGDPCEDVHQLGNWIEQSFHHALGHPDFEIRAVNFSAYGASFVHIDQQGKPVTSLYNYLKPYPAGLRDAFYDSHGGAVTFSILTASPVLGSLNSGMQLYRIKKERPAIFRQIAYSLHLPQYLSYLISRKPYSDITSIGCHTNLWNFAQHTYHEWVYREGVLDKFAPLVSSAHSERHLAGASTVEVGVGLHDSSAALIPYLTSFLEPFILVSTGTWCINLNPFNDKPLSIAELREDCLCYLSYQGKPVKASRLFAGYQHEQETKRLAIHFNKPENYYASISYDPEIRARLQKPEITPSDQLPEQSLFQKRGLNNFSSYEEAYHQLIADLIADQEHAIKLVLEGTDVKRIFVDGGFGNNSLFMHLLADSFRQVEVFAASVPQATALGAALAIHKSWNSRPLPNDIIDLKFYAVSHDAFAR